MLVNGLRKPTVLDARLAWDRLCVLHILTLGSIHEFGYRWQRPSETDFARAVMNITSPATLKGFDNAMYKPLALAQREAQFPHLFTRRGRAIRTIRHLLKERRRGH
jgi:hypothetical protein